MFKCCKLLLPLAIIIFISSCKVSRVTTQPPEQQDSLSVKETVPTDTTVAVVQDSVEISVHRLLKDTLTIIGVGDIMMGTNYPDDRYLPPE